MDSPGLNGIAEGHLEITREQIKSSHAAIFMFNAERPGSKSDFQHLQDLKSKSKNIFFVLNKIDVIKESERSTPEQVIDGLKKSYKSQFPEETEIPKFWPVAGGAALVARDKSVKEYMGHEIISDDKRREELEKISRMGDFEARLLKYLTQGERTKAQLSEPVDKSLNILKEFRDKLEQTKNALNSESSFEDLASKHYAEHVGKPFYDGLVRFITSGPIIAMVLQGENAISGIRKFMGKTDPNDAEVGSIRGDFAQVMRYNSIHGSDSKESAEREISLYFKEEEICDGWETMLEMIMRECEE